MNCCQCQGIEMEFNRKVAADDLKRYRQKGPDRTTRMLIDALKAEGIQGMTLLDIGGGVGVIQHELLKAGVRSATGVDASTAYIEVAKEEAQRRGHADRINLHHGDFVALAPNIPAADIVTLDRVICCYHHMEGLLGRSSEKARKFYGVVYPRDTWWMKISLPIINFFYWLRRSPFRTFLHLSAAVDAVVRANGLKRRHYSQTIVWQVVVYGHSNLQESQTSLSAPIFRPDSA